MSQRAPQLPRHPIQIPALSGTALAVGAQPVNSGPPGAAIRKGKVLPGPLAECRWPLAQAPLVPTALQEKNLPEGLGVTQRVYVTELEGCCFPPFFFYYCYCHIALKQNKTKKLFSEWGAKGIPFSAFTLFNVPV